MEMEKLLDIIKIVVPIILIAVLGFCVWRTTRPGKAKTRTTFIELWSEIGAILLVVLALVFLLAGARQNSRDMETVLTPVTAENTPVNLFLLLDENTTRAYVNRQIEENGWDTVSYSTLGEDRETVDVAVDSEEYSYLLNQEENGVVLSMDFRQSDGSLLAARLTIRTDDGTATCYYYPTEYTEWGRDTGLTLTVKGRWYTLTKTYHPATTAEAIDIAYPVVYPNGLA